jgi:hypothetical protein
MTQVQMAKLLGVAHKQISDTKNRADMHTSTLRRSIEAMGGKLSLVAEFPDRNSCCVFQHHGIGHQGA